MLPAARATVQLACALLFMTLMQQYFLAPLLFFTCAALSAWILSSSSAWWEQQFTRWQPRLGLLIHFLKQLLQAEVQRGEELWLRMRDLRHKGAQGFAQVPTLPEYKYYHTLMLKLLKLQRQGAALSPELWDDLLERLRSDLQFERQLRSQSIGSFAQFLAAASVIWLFIVVSLKLLALKIAWSQLGLIVLLQLLGLGLFSLLQRLAKRWCFRGLAQLVQSLLSLLALSSARLSIKQCVEQAQLENIAEQNLLPRAQRLFQRLLQLIERWQLSGQPLRQDLLYLLADIWDTQGQALKRFEQISLLSRFFILVTCFMGSYFLFLYTLLSRFLIE